MIVRRVDEVYAHTTYWTGCAFYGTAEKGALCEGLFKGRFLVDGLIEYSDGTTYDGQLSQGQYHGQGTLVVQNYNQSSYVTRDDGRVVLTPAVSVFCGIFRRGWLVRQN